MTIQEEFYNRIDNDNGYDNQKLGDDLIKIAEKHHKQQLSLCSVSGSTLLPDGWKVYKCTDCQEINIKKDNRQITVGFCDNCEHPLWNDDVD